MTSFQFPALSFAKEVEICCSDATMTGRQKQRRLGQELIHAVHRSEISPSEFAKAIQPFHALNDYPRALEHLRADSAFRRAWTYVVAMRRSSFSWNDARAQATLAKLDLILSWMGPAFNVSAAYLLRDIAYDESLKDHPRWTRMTPMLTFLINRITTWYDFEKVVDVAEERGQRMLLSFLQNRKLQIENSGQDLDEETEHTWIWDSDSDIDESDSDDDDDDPFAAKMIGEDGKRESLSDSSESESESSDDSSDSSDSSDSDSDDGQEAELEVIRKWSPVPPAKKSADSPKRKRAEETDTSEALAKLQRT